MVRRETGKTRYNFLVVSSTTLLTWLLSLFPFSKPLFPFPCRHLCRPSSGISHIFRSEITPLDESLMRFIKFCRHVINSTRSLPPGTRHDSLFPQFVSLSLSFLPRQTFICLLFVLSHGKKKKRKIPLTLKRARNYNCGSEELIKSLRKVGIEANKVGAGIYANVTLGCFPKWSLLRPCTSEHFSDATLPNAYVLRIFFQRRWDPNPSLISGNRKTQTFKKN